MTLKYTLEQVQDAVKDSLSLSETIRKLGGNTRSGGVRLFIKNKINKYNIDISHFKPYNRSGCQDFSKKNASDYLIIGDKGTRVKTYLLRRSLIESGIELTCSNKDCHVDTSWLDKKIVLQIDHINGIYWDNRLENLRFLCPNCHSQTPTYSQPKHIKDYCCLDCHISISKQGIRCKSCSAKKHNKRKIKDRPSKEQLKLDVENLGFCGTGRKYEVSDNSIRKWLK